MRQDQRNNDHEEATRIRPRIRAGTVALCLFLGLWVVYGLLINSNNIIDFGQATVEAIVDQHRFSVEDLPVWTTESFEHDGHQFSNKQPGQAFIGSVAYAQLRLFGLSYARDRVLAGALVIFLTASMLTALAAAALFLLARDLDERRTIIWPLAAALAWALATTAFAYSGIAHHDVMATDLLVIALFVLYKLRRAELSDREAKTLGFLAGFLLGLTITTSMLHFFMASIFGVYFLSLGRWRTLLPFFLGGMTAVVPMLIYNAVCFGNPFLPAALAMYRYTGDDGDVRFFLDRTNFEGRLEDYYRLVRLYAPILWVGLAGLLFLPSKARREQLFVIAAILALVVYVTNILGVGTCAYGPRYLLPIMPFCALGIVGFSRLRFKIVRILAGLGVLYVAFDSFRINLVGAAMGAMHCNIAGYAYPEYMLKISRGEMPQFPLVPYLLPVVVVFFAIWAYLWLRRQQQAEQERA